MPPLPLDSTVVLDSATWGALALALSVLGAVLTVLAWRRRGPAAGLRAAAWTLLPIAAWLTGTLRLAASVVDDVAGWAVRLVFSPAVWLGVAVAALSAALFVVSGVMRAKGIGQRRRGVAVKQEPAPGREVKARGRSATAEPVDPEMAEIEAILKKRGI